MGFAFSVRHRVVFSLQTLSNLLAAMREEDFSVLARAPAATTRWRSHDRGELALAALREQRLGALEATALLRTVMKKSKWRSLPLIMKQNCGW